MTATILDACPRSITLFLPNMSERGPQTKSPAAVLKLMTLWTSAEIDDGEPEAESM